MAAWTSGCPPSIQSTYITALRSGTPGLIIVHTHTHTRNESSIYPSICLHHTRMCRAVSECVVAVHK